LKETLKAIYETTTEMADERNEIAERKAVDIIAKS